MSKRYYPAVLERGEHGVVGLWFPDFPGCVAGGASQEEAIARAVDTLEAAMLGFAERDQPLPEPSSIAGIALPDGCDFIGVVAVGATPPGPSERVNIYLPKALIERADRHAADLGMNRSSFFGLAVSRFLSNYGPMLTRR
jgi:predicted RNase H-like HicB family nuclease